MVFADCELFLKKNSLVLAFRAGEMARLQFFIRQLWLIIDTLELEAGCDGGFSDSFRFAS